MATKILNNDQAVKYYRDPGLESTLVLWMVGRKPDGNYLIYRMRRQSRLPKVSRIQCGKIIDKCHPKNDGNLVEWIDENGIAWNLLRREEVSEEMLLKEVLPEGLYDE